MSLEIHPEFGAGAEVLRESERGVGTDRAITMDENCTAKSGVVLDIMDDVYDDLKQMKPATLEQIVTPGGLLDQIIEKTTEELLSIKAPDPSSV